jgi:putative phage-type endonuclease
MSYTSNSLYNIYTQNDGELETIIDAIANIEISTTRNADRADPVIMYSNDDSESESDSEYVVENDSGELNIVKDCIQNYINTIDEMMMCANMFETSNSEGLNEYKCDDNISLAETETVAENEEQETEQWYNILSSEDMADIDAFILEHLDIYLETNILRMSNPGFHEIMVGEISELVFDLLTEAYHLLEIEEPSVESYVTQVCEHFFETNHYIPLRSYKNTFLSLEDFKENAVNTMKLKIDGLRAKKQPEQRTPEWYEFRHNLLTASSIWKVFGSEAQLNQLICDKCRPYQSYGNNVNTQSPLHWGQKYEPVSIMIYEHMYNTTVADFGCIPHDTYDFIGASPDGINVNSSNGRYGRMIEVKNIFNREINGIPKEEYWIQMQVQMETCDLDECDFIETRFKEYEGGADDFYLDETHTYRGIILYFYRKNMFDTMCGTPSSNSPFYVYSPVDLSLEKDAVESWISEQMEKHRDTYILFEKQYWYLDEISCVLVKRNRPWFEKAKDEFKKVWDIIQREKVEGYEHRLPKKKIPKIEVTHEDGQDGNAKIYNMTMNSNVCLIKLDENGNVL